MTRFVTALAIIVISNAASAASHDLSTFIGEYDLDRNGSVSKEEFVTERERRFTATDQDRNGGLSRVEYLEEFRARLTAEKPNDEQEKRQIKQAEIRFGVLDSNKDAQISSAEFMYSGWMMYARHDADKNGAITDADGQGVKQAAAT